tara:strand:+ start:228 stop:392 length:165 start_codon:yes stop_codon:yes gene_type:complete
MPSTKNKTYGENRICEGKGCRVILSKYNDDTICGVCQQAVDLSLISTNVGKYVK